MEISFSVKKIQNDCDRRSLWGCIFMSFYFFLKKLKHLGSITSTWINIAWPFPSSVHSIDSFFNSFFICTRKVLCKCHLLQVSFVNSLLICSYLKNIISKEFKWSISVNAVNSYILVVFTKQEMSTSQNPGAS